MTGCYILVNKWALHEMVQVACPEKKTTNWDRPTADSVLSKILEKYEIRETDVNKPNLLEQLFTKVRDMYYRLKAKCNRGGFYSSKEQERWHKSNMTLRLGGAKRKADHELERETKRRKLCESTINEQRQVIKTMEKERNESPTKLEKMIWATGHTSWSLPLS